MDQGLNQARLCLGQFLPVGRVDSDVAQCRCAVILNVDVGGRQQLDQNWNGAGIDELLAVVICSGMNSQTKRVS